MSSLNNPEKTTRMSCWACAEPVKDSDFFCKQCQKIQPPVERSPFAILNCPVQLELAWSFLEQRYLDCQNRLHPDRFVRATALEQDFATQQTAFINKAYATLKHPLSRAESYIACHFPRANLEEPQTPPHVLMQLMQLRDRLESLESLEEIENLSDEITRANREAWRQLEQLCDAQEWQEAHGQLDIVRYWQRMLGDITNKLKLWQAI